MDNCDYQNESLKTDKNRKLREKKKKKEKKSKA